MTRNLGKMVPRFVDGQLVDLESGDGAVRVIGAPIWSAGWGAKEADKSRITTSGDGFADWTTARTAQAADLPPSSRGVNDSIAMAVRTITAANTPDTEGQK